jgi:hypothetical protein
MIKVAILSLATCAVAEKLLTADGGQKVTEPILHLLQPSPVLTLTAMYPCSFLKGKKAFN